jgi:hypothetical protein
MRKNTKRTFAFLSCKIYCREYITATLDRGLRENSGKSFDNICPVHASVAALHEDQARFPASSGSHPLVYVAVVYCRIFPSLHSVRSTTFVGLCPIRFPNRSTNGKSESMEYRQLGRTGLKVCRRCFCPGVTCDMCQQTWQTRKPLACPYELPKLDCQPAKFAGQHPVDGAWVTYGYQVQVPEAKELLSTAFNAGVNL